jgi:hypothetical protein
MYLILYHFSNGTQLLVFLLFPIKEHPMKTNFIHSLKKLPIIFAFGTIVCSGFMSAPPPVQADGGAFIGGMIAGHIVGGAVRRDRIKTAAAVEAASQPKTTETVYVQHSKSSTTSTEQKLGQLDKLAADGYITKEEYKARRKALLDSM